MRFTFKRTAVGLTLAIMFSTFSLAETVSSQTRTEMDHDFLPFSFHAFVPCANGGAGELVLVQGTQHVIGRLTVNRNRDTSKNFFHPLGAEGIGLVTGDVYRLVGVTQELDSVPLSNGAFATFFINNFRVIGPGPDNNFQVHQLRHMTINANGDVTVVVDDTSIVCN